MAGQPYDMIVNESIKQTMTRSFNTLATVIITLVALLALGGASLKNFAFALLVGICSGGYHSIFYSAPLVLVFRKRQLEAAAQAPRAGQAQDRAATPRARAEGATLQSRGGAAREDIVAARRERREKAKAARAVAPGTPARYRKRRTEATGGVAVEEPLIGDETETIDPLDAPASRSARCRLGTGARRDLPQSRRVSKSPKSSTPRAARPKALPPPTPSEAAFEAVLASFSLPAVSAEPAAAAEIPPAAGDSERWRNATISSIACSPKATSICETPTPQSATRRASTTKLAGVSFEGRQDTIAGLREGVALELRRQPDNPLRSQCDRRALRHAAAGVHQGRHRGARRAVDRRRREVRRDGRLAHRRRAHRGRAASSRGQRLRASANAPPRRAARRHAPGSAMSTRARRR